MTNIMKRNNGASATRSMTPFGGLVDDVLQNTLSRFFDDRPRGFNDPWQGSSVPVNVKETDKSYEVEVVAPGLKKEDFQVSMSNNQLTVSFEHKEETESDRSGYLRREYRQQSFARSFNLDDSVDTEKISARYTDGVLHLTLPKKEGAQRLSRNINVE